MEERELVFWTFARFRSDFFEFFSFLRLIEPSFCTLIVRDVSRILSFLQPRSLFLRLIVRDVLRSTAYFEIFFDLGGKECHVFAPYCRGTIRALRGREA